MIRCFAIGLLALLASTQTARAVDLSVLSAGAVEPGLRAFSDAIKSARGDSLVIQFNAAPQIVKRLAAGERYDILIAPTPVIEQAVKDGKAVAGSSVLLGRVGIGVVVRSGVKLPDITSPDALKRDLLAADSVVYNSASTGLYLEKQLAAMGLIDQIKAKTTRYADGAAVVAHISKGQGNEIGFGAVTEIKLFVGKGVQYVGPVPAAMQNYTSYSAAQMTGATAPDAAARVLKEMATPATRATFASAGIE
jgi:molybdate transport system substrate-binding protein